ncbi:MAG: RNA-binding S4 domain-containing protein [Bacteroidales bacterium]|nr:RNA-binding S4 domain-containing protein [Bacteroidales bacterium]
MDSVRIDKYLWSIRAFKTRSDATQACRGGKVRVNGADAKASREVKVGDVLTVRKGPATFTYKVNELVSKRQGAKNVAAFADNLTPQEEYAKLARPVETVVFRRDPGAGRPTKRDRRQLDDLVLGTEESVSASWEEGGYEQWEEVAERWEEEEKASAGEEERKGFDMWAEEEQQESWFSQLDEELDALEDGLDVLDERDDNKE